MKRTGATLFAGAQWGDECKGKLSMYYVERNKVRFVYKAGNSNAEHGVFFEENGLYVCCSQLPLGFLGYDESLVRIGPGSCVDPEKLFKEMDRFNLYGRVAVDPRCPIITQEHKDWERANLKGGSTYSGCGPSRAEFILRKAKQAKDILQLKGLLLDVPEEINRVAKDEEVVVEGSQGALLALSLSNDYPAVTSKNTTAAAIMDDVGLNWRLTRECIMVVKSMPTRESNGPMNGAEEMSVEEMQASGLYEPSSIDGGRRRKIKGIDFLRLAYAARLNGTETIALTFLDHFDPEMKDVRDHSKITNKTRDLIARVEECTGAKVRALETGKLYDSIIDLGL